MLQAERDKREIVAVEGAVLIETGTYKEFDEVWVITIPKDEAFQRVKVRNPEMPDQDILNRLQRQTTDEERLKVATFSYSSVDPFEKNRLKIDSRLDEIRRLIQARI